MQRLKGLPREIEHIVRQRVLERVPIEFVLRESRLTITRRLTIEAGSDGNALCGAEREYRAEREIVDAVMLPVARTVSLATGHIRRQPNTLPGTAKRHASGGEGAGASIERDARGGSQGRRSSHEIDHATHRLRPEGNLG